LPKIAHMICALKFSARVGGAPRSSSGRACVWLRPATRFPPRPRLSPRTPRPGSRAALRGGPAEAVSTTPRSDTLEFGWLSYQSAYPSHLLRRRPCRGPSAFPTPRSPPLRPPLPLRPEPAQVCPSPSAGSCPSFYLPSCPFSRCRSNPRPIRVRRSRAERGGVAARLSRHSAERSRAGRRRRR